jgi:Major Facilitator Superfamily
MGRVMRIIGVPLLLAPIIGPVIGGLLVEAVSWRWIFFVNMPVATLAFLLAIKLLPRASRRGVQRGSTSSAPASSRAASRSSSTPRRGRPGDADNRASADDARRRSFADRRLRRSRTSHDEPGARPDARLYAAQRRQHWRSARHRAAGSRRRSRRSRQGCSTGCWPTTSCSRRCCSQVMATNPSKSKPW